MNGLFPFQFVGLVNLKHYGFEAFFSLDNCRDFTLKLNSRCASSQWRMAKVV